jgi:hypothetical protein
MEHAEDYRFPTNESSDSSWPQVYGHGGARHTPKGFCVPPEFFRPLILDRIH